MQHIIFALVGSTDYRMSNQTLNFMKKSLHRIYHCVILLSFLQVHTYLYAQNLVNTENLQNTEDFIKHGFWGESLASSISPDAKSMIQYGQSEINPYLGTLGITIPLYTYQDEGFTIPISINYASNGYKPNIQTGILGLGWYLNVGGVITREVKGLLDEEGLYSYDNILQTDYIYNFQDKRIGSNFTGFPELITPTVRGFGSLYSLDDFSYDDYILDFVYYGKVGEEYYPAYIHPNDSKHDYAYETRPDIFHFSFMGYTGSFILQPNKKVIVFDCNHPAKEIDIDIVFNKDSQGFSTFIITVGDRTQFYFSNIEKCKTFIESSDDDKNIRINNTWKLTKIVTPNGREAIFEYGKSFYTYAYIPTKIHDRYFRVVQGQVSNPQAYVIDKTIEENRPTIYETDTNCITSIIVKDRCKIEFSYSNKPQEKGLGFGESALKLDSITIYNQNSNTIKTCNFQYSTNTISDNKFSTKTQGITFLKNVTISGEGTYSMDYNERGLTFPEIDTYSIDWYGYYNDNVAEHSFLPNKEVAENSNNYLLTMRKPKFETTMYGMLTRITYPTGGYTKFQYEQNNYSNDVTEMATSGIDTPTSGLRISNIIDYDYNGSEIQQRTFSYINTDGTSSGKLLWRSMPQIIYAVKCENGYNGITRNSLSSIDDFPYSKKSHIEYLRVIEERVQNTNNKKIITEYQYETATFYAYKDLILRWDNDFYWEAGDWHYHVSLYNEEKIIRQFVAQSQSKIGGKLKSITQYASDINHPVINNQYRYDHYDPYPGIADFKTKFMCMGLLFEYSFDLQTIYTCQSKEQQYNENGELIIEKVTDFNLDDYFRIGETKTTDSKGNILSNKYYYHPEVPAYLTGHICKRGDAVIEATKFNFKCNADRVYLPSSCERGLISSESPSSPLTYRIDKTFDKYDSFGHPLQITDKDGKSTCFIWGYNGQYVIAKIENIKYEDLSQHCDIAENPYPNYLPNPLESSLRALGENIMVTTYQYKPLVGVQCITDASGHKIFYDYDKDGKLICVKDDKGNPVQSYQYNITTYDNN